MFFTFKIYAFSACPHYYSVSSYHPFFLRSFNSLSTGLCVSIFALVHLISYSLISGQPGVTTIVVGWTYFTQLFHLKPFSIFLVHFEDNWNSYNHPQRPIWPVSTLCLWLYFLLTPPWASCSSSVWDIPRLCFLTENSFSNILYGSLIYSCNSLLKRDFMSFSVLWEILFPIPWHLSPLPILSFSTTHTIQHFVVVVCVNTCKELALLIHIFRD